MRPNSSVTAENFLVNHCGQRQNFKHLVYHLVDLNGHLLLALVHKPVEVVDILEFVISSENVDI